MLFQAISTFLFIAQCSALVEYKMVNKTPDEMFLRTTLIEILNEPRKAIVFATNASSLHWLKWDESLAWMAHKTLDSCENYERSDEDFIQIRLKLSEKTTTTAQQTSVETIIHDIWQPLDDFAEYKNGRHSTFGHIRRLDFIPLFNFFQKDWTRVGCAFQICKDPLTGDEKNLVCYLGPKVQLDEHVFEMKGSRSEMCKDCHCRSMLCLEDEFDVASLSDEDFKAKILTEFNGARSQFALKANAGLMHKLTWDDDLAQSAAVSGQQCPGNYSHTLNIRELFADAFLDNAAGLGAIGEMYGTSTGEFQHSETYDSNGMYTILWANMEKVGCALTPPCQFKVFCHFGDVGAIDGKLYEKGAPCSKCEKDCEDGLCKETVVTTTTGVTSDTTTSSQP
ncbi:unnamed protein product [Caenorhabditis sp. 36 PRJEB53466]|nr:unnamed protein product [Caenorhabditis sp. 36 PRJEB53466]